MDIPVLQLPRTQGGSKEGSSETRAQQPSPVLCPVDSGRGPSGPRSLGSPKLSAFRVGGLSSPFCRMGRQLSLRAPGPCGGGAEGSEGGRKGCECGGGPRAAPPLGGSPGRSILARAGAAAATAVGEGSSAVLASRGARRGPSPPRSIPAERRPRLCRRRRLPGGAAWRRRTCSRPPTCCAASR